jgi:hypothetical protein
MPNPASRGKMLQDQLLSRLRAFQHGPAAGAQRPIILGVSNNGVLVGGLTLDGFLAQARRVLLDSGRVFRWEDTIEYEFGRPPNRHLVPLSVHGKAEPHAAGVLSNLFGVGVPSEEGQTQSLVPAKLASALLADEELWLSLPALRSYARRAVYDEAFRLCGPGWHAAQGILVHGPDIVPAQLPPVSTGGRSIDRLPPFLKRLLQDFCFASDADLENALALFLTGLLANHFVANPKPAGFVDGNQQDIGKTLLCQVLGQVLDGREPERIPLARDEELEKKLGALLRESNSSVFLFDNIKAKVDSAFLEANALSPVLSVRLLGHSRNVSRPNAYLWLVTSNLTSGSSDMITRGVPIRLRYEGNPGARVFQENLVEFVQKHRLDLLAELAGLVERWKLAGRPAARDVWPAGRPAPRHRCRAWAETIGGILAVSGFTDFLANVEEARAAMDEGLQALATLAEHVISKKVAGFVNPPATDADRGQLPREWVKVFAAAGVGQEKLADKNTRGRETWVGTFLSGKTDRAVAVTVGTQSGTAVLRKNPVRSDQKRYYFEVDFTTPVPGAGSQGGGAAAAAVVAPGASQVAPEPATDLNVPASPPLNQAGPTSPVAPGEAGDALEWV